MCAAEILDKTPVMKMNPKSKSANVLMSQKVNKPRISFQLESDKDDFKAAIGNFSMVSRYCVEILSIMI